jgi:hypothetical protein
LVKPNYQYEKRQKELAKKRKQEEKQKRKASRHEGETAESANPSPPELDPK